MIYFNFACSICFFFSEGILGRIFIDFIELASLFEIFSFAIFLKKYK
jgi:hypothetical protein